MKKLPALVVACLVALASYWYLSPYVTMYWMKAAIEAKNADDFNQYVDYAKLRESLKGQLTAHLTGEMGKITNSGNEYERAGAALGAMFGLALVDRMVDSLVRPEMVMKMMAEAKMQPPSSSPSSASSEASGKHQVEWNLERVSVNRVIARQKNEDKFGVVFDRTGFATWKLTELRISKI